MTKFSLGTCVVALMLVVICKPTSADLIHGLVIDDFEEGPFWTDQGTFVSGLSSQSCLGGERQIYTDQLSGPVQLVVSSADDAVLIEGGDFGGFYRISYPLPLVDLTDGGKFDRLVLRFTAVPVGLTVNVAVYVMGIPLGSPRQLPQTPGEMSIPLSDFNLSLEQVDQLSVVFDASSGPFALELADIRLRGPLARLIYVDVPISVFTGDFPLPELLISTLVKDESGGFLPRDPLFMTVEQVSHEGTPVPVSLLVEDSVPGVEPGPAFGLTIADDLTVAKRADHREANLILDLPASLPGESNALVAPPTVEFTAGGKAALLEFLLETHDAGGSPYRATEYRLRLEIPDERALGFVQVMAEPLSPSSFELGFQAIPPVGKAPTATEVIVRAELSSSEAPIVHSTATPSVQADSGIRLAAEPTVWSGRTRIWARGTALRGVIRVFDASGREVRRLDLAGGLRYVDWDGRDNDGTQVTSGVYYALFEGHGRKAATKMVRLK